MKINWKTKKLGEVCKIIKGRKPIFLKEKTDECLPYLTANFLRGKNVAEYVSKTDKNAIKSKKMK